MKIVADDKIPFLRGVLEPYAEVIYVPGSQISRDILVDTDALIIRTRTECTESLLENTGIKFIGTATIGFDHIDTDYCLKNNITWTNAPGCNSSSVQQYIAAALLRISGKTGQKLNDLTLGIVGVGNVGSKVEKFARIAGMKVLLNDPPRARIEGNTGFSNIVQILTHSDIITLHVPLNKTGTDYTYHLFDEGYLSRMKPEAWLINSSRGEVVDTNSLKDSLTTRHLKGAVIDVWENEPEIDPELMKLAFIATPHIAGYSVDGKANGTAIIVNSLKRFFSLPGNDWYPENLPFPAKLFREIECRGKSYDDILREAVDLTYSIEEDHLRLLKSPDEFEKQRGAYPVRRELSSFTLKLKGCTQSVTDKLTGLGFHLI